MMVLLLIAKMVTCTVILYGYYWLFLRNKRFHHYNRFYLLASTVLSIIVPFIKIPVYLETDTTTGQLVNNSIKLISVSRWEEELIEHPQTQPSTWFTLQNALFIGYALVTVVLLYFLCRSIIYIRNISRKYPYERINTFRLYNTTEPGTPFSFFRSIFWNKRLDFNSKEGQQIFRHELFHVKQKHSADILFLELACTLFWLNPIFHLIKKEMKAIHEFLADQHAVSDDNQFHYAELLILQSINRKKNTLSHYFFQNHIKRRIAMITQLKNKHYTYWTRLMVLPVSIILFCAIALYGQSTTQTNFTKTSLPSEPQTALEPITIVIDAGHGGEDQGAKSPNGLLEKDLALTIARQIKKLAGAYNINVIMTREEDSYPTLKERTALAASAKADMIISIHIGATEPATSKSGFDIYVTNRNQQTLEHSKLLGQSIATQIKQLYEVGDIKQRKENGIWILDAAPCPAVLIECGYITNDKDLAFIANNENQEKIAKSILEGVARYKREQRPNSTTSISISHTGKQTSPTAFIIENDLFRHKLQRHYIKSLSSLIPATGTHPEGTVYFSLEIDADRKIKQFTSYDEKPAARDNPYYEIVIVSPSNSVADEGRQRAATSSTKAGLISLVRKATAELRLEDPFPSFQPGKYFIEISFRIAKDNVKRVDGETPLSIETIYTDTIPQKQIDPAKQEEIRIARQELAEQHQKLQNEKHLLLKKQQEVNTHRQALAESKRIEIAEKKQLHIQRQKEIELERQRITEKRMHTDQENKQLQIQKQKETELARQQKTEEQMHAMQAEKQRHLEKQQESRQAEKQRHLEKQQELKLAEAKMERGLNDDVLQERNSDPTFTKVEKKPEYPGGSDRWMNYVSGNLQYPEEARKKGISGTVTVRFIVDRKGNPFEVVAVSGPQELRAEAERLIKQSGQWVPARQNGHIVKAYVEKDIQFQPSRK